MSQPHSHDEVEAVTRDVSIKDTAKEVFKQFGEDDVPGLAAEVAYHLVFALAPLLIFVLSMAVIIDSFTGVDVSGQLQDLITEHAPSEAQEVLDTLVQNAVTEASGGFASFGAISALLLALWSASNGVATLMKAFNRAYDVPEARSFVMKKVVAIGLTVALTLCVNLAFVLFVFGGDIGELVADWFGLGSAFNWAWNIGRYPIAVLFVMLLLAMLYYFGPNIAQSFRFISPGSVIATVLWIAVVFGFQIYLSLANPGSAYGVFGGLIVLLFFLYITGIVFLIGAEVNAVVARQSDPKTIRDLMGETETDGLPSDTARRTAQLSPGWGRRRRERQADEAPATAYAERGPATRFAALGAVGAATAFMLFSKVKGIFGK